MKIKSVSCRQFAGLRNLKPVQFQDGLNIIYGPNESGKSTLVGLIYSLLWQSYKVDGRTDKEYKKLYFPAEVRSGSRGSTIDGKLVIEGDDGKYTITKKWGAVGSGDLETPNAVLYESTDSKAYAEAIRVLLKYGEGVYREAIFANQKTIDSVLQALLGGKLNSDLSAVASSALLDMGGISSEKFLAEIDNKMKELENSWDWRTDGPKGGRDKKLTKNVGEILKAYYKLEESREKLIDLRKKVNAVGEADEAYKVARAKYEKAIDVFNDFSRYYTLLVKLKNTNELLENARRDLKKRQGAAENWPVLATNLDKARSLEEELARAEVIYLWEQLESIKKKKAEAERALSGLQLVEEADVDSAERLSEEIRKIENRLKKFSALVSFTLQEGYELTVTSAVDGRKVDIEGSAFEATEAVRIEIPGVAVFDLSAANLNVEEEKAELEEKRAVLKSILAKYNVASALDLKAIKKRKDNDRVQLEKDLRGYEAELKKTAGGREIDDIQADYEAALKVPTRSKDVIQEKIRQLTPKPVGTYISLCEQTIGGYEKEFLSQNTNAVEIENLIGKIGQYEKDREEGNKIPEKFRQINDPEGRKKVLENDAGKKRAECASARDTLSYARGVIKALEEADNYATVEDLQETVSDKEAELESLKEKFKAWRQIKTVAEEILNSADANPLQQFEDDFRKYLAFLSEDGVTLSSLGKKLQADIYSGDNRMTFELLSEGTKDTVALAFRLAVIKFLFPNGGGFAVFDDPFTDMDAERRARACRLLKEFAENNQIIFVTCDRSYADTLQGNFIDFSNVR